MKKCELNDLEAYVVCVIGDRLKRLIGEELDYDRINECFTFDYADFGFYAISNTVFFGEKRTIPFSSNLSFIVYDELVNFVIEISVDVVDDEIVETIVDVY